MLERTMLIPPGIDRTIILGVADRNIKMIRETLGVNIVAQSGRVVLRGDEESVNKAAATVERLTHMARQSPTLTRQQVLDAIMTSPDTPIHDESLEGDGQVAWEGPLNVFASGRPIRPRSTNQQAYLEAIRTMDLVFGTGPAGTGKTYLAVAAAVHMLKIGRVRRVILARPAVEAGERLGFLPGDLQQKVNPYLRPLFDALGDMLDYQSLQRFLSSDVVEIIPLAFMRGRTLNNSVIILDEAQNATVSQMLMFLTRTGRASRSIVTGDPSQIDLDETSSSGLIDAIGRLRRVEGVSTIAMDATDIVRHRLVQRIVHAYESLRNHRPLDAQPRSTAPEPPADVL